MLDAFKRPDHIPKSIKSERLTLRQFRMQDADEFAQLFAESFEDHLEPWSPPVAHDLEGSVGRRAAREHILAALEKWDDGTDYRFFITLNATGEIVGQIGLTQVIRGVSQSSFIGYWIGKKHINQGYATEAVVLAIEFSFEVLKLHRASLWIAIENRASLEIPKKLGLRFEGTALQALFLGGRWQDTHIYAITLEEWLVRKDELKSKWLRNTELEERKQV
jgi:ribosomal-protein-alanine N-acetyltransferase